MRLTVRTLLAYLDGVLDKDASAALKAKIDESEFATQLAGKISGSIKQSDLGAPSVQAVNPIENPNTIAEYLDNVLQPEITPELERILLESDIHMSEAAACHQILTLVLSKPATVPQNLRDKLYKIADRIPQPSNAGEIASTGTLSSPSVSALDIPATSVPVEQPGDASLEPVATPFREAAAAPTANGQATVGLNKSKPRKVDIPEYLRAGRSSRILPWLMTLGLCAVLLFVIAKAFQPVSRVVIEDAVALTDVTPDETDTSPPETTIQTPEVTEAADDVADPVTEVAPEEPGTSAEPVFEPTEPTVPTDPVATAIGVSMEEPAVPVEPATEPATVDTDAGDPAVMVPESPFGDPGIVADPTAPAEPTATIPEDVADGRSPAMIPDISSDPTIDPDPAAGVDSAAAEPPILPGAKPLLAKSDAEGTILLQPDASGWKRINKGELIDDGKPIVTLPSFRSQVLLNNGVAFTAVGPAEFQISSVDRSVRLGYGRYIFKPMTTDASIALVIGSRQATLDFPREDASAAMQVTSFRSPGADPTLDNSRQAIIAVQALSENVDWSIDAGQPLSLAAPVRWSQIGDAAPASDIVEEPADWIATPPANEVSIEGMARNGLLELAVPNKRIELALRESVGYRRAEVAALGARSLLMLGASDNYFGAKGILDDPSQKSHWQDHYAALRWQIDRSPETARKLKESIARMNAAEAASIFRLLSGYSQKQLVAGADFEVVEALNDASLPIRVLALENLRQITGTTLSFRPHDSGPRRVSSAKKWDTKLRAGDIRWTEEPKPESAIQL